MAGGTHDDTHGDSTGQERAGEPDTGSRLSLLARRLDSAVGYDRDRTTAAYQSGFTAAVAVVALGVVATGAWRTGIRWFGGALVVAAVVRVALKPRDAGMLAVRSKPIDAVLLVGVGAALVVLAGSIPDQPG